MVLPLAQGHLALRIYQIPRFFKVPVRLRNRTYLARGLTRLGDHTYQIGGSLFQLNSQRILYIINSVFIFHKDKEDTGKRKL